MPINSFGLVTSKMDRDGLVMIVKDDVLAKTTLTNVVRPHHERECAIISKTTKLVFTFHVLVPSLHRVGVC